MFINYENSAWTVYVMVLVTAEAWGCAWTNHIMVCMDHSSNGLHGPFI